MDVIKPAITTSFPPVTRWNIDPHESPGGMFCLLVRQSVITLLGSQLLSVVHLQSTSGYGISLAATMMEIVRHASEACQTCTHQDKPAFQQSAADLAAE